MVDDEILTPEQAERSAFSHVLWNCVGGSSHPVKPEVVRYRLQAGDRVLLCSDGLHGMINDDVIASTIQANAGSAETVKCLLEKAMAEGGRDNVTAVLAECVPS